MALGLATSPASAWYVSRSSGYVALLLFTVTVMLGIATTLRAQSDRWPAFVTQSLHRNVSLLATSFLGIHIVTILTDKYVQLGNVLPWTSTFRPVWVGMGVVATYLAVALVITGLGRQYMSFRLWKMLHWLSYPLWLLALAHGIGAGTDTQQPWGMALALACMAGVALTALWRVLDADAPAAWRLSGVTAIAFAVAIVGGWWITGPLQSTWK